MIQMFPKPYVAMTPSRATKIYLASPWFNPKQMERMETTLGVLRDWEAEDEDRYVYAPIHECLCPPDAGLEQQESAYRSNLRAITSADIIVAVTDEKDIGTIYELGYGAANRDTAIASMQIDGHVPEGTGPVLVGLAYSLGDRPFNLMLSRGLDVVCRTAEELRSYLTIGEIPELTGPIE